MLLLAGVCGVVLLLVYLTNTISYKRKLVLMQIELSDKSGVRITGGNLSRES